jgi:hypothetical protein
MLACTTDNGTLFAGDVTRVYTNSAISTGDSKE